MIHHAAIRLPLDNGVLADRLPRWLLGGLQYNGFEAVFLFFVISGSLIASNSMARWGALAAIDVRAFYGRRAARIVPCLLILVAALSALALAGAPRYTMEQPAQTVAGSVMSALGLYLNVCQARTGWLPAGWGVLWSLSVEEVFYLAFPVVCLLVARTRLLVPSLALLALSIPVVRGNIHHDPIWAEENYLQGMAAIATGVLAALLARRWPRVPRSTVRWTTALGLVGLLAVFCAGEALWHVLHHGDMLVLTFSAASLVLASRWHAPAWAPASASTGAFAWLRSFGRLSYEIYLVHMFVVWAVVDAVKGAGGDPRWSMAWYAPVLAGAWALGWLVARFISQPLARRLTRACALPASAFGKEVVA